jgi:predicted nuclease of predicted toxin-antitoxin system
VRLLLDENLSPAQAALLREAGFDAVSVIESGLGGAPDERVREFAIEGGRVLVTLDSDFANMLRFPPAGTPGVLRLKIHPATEEAVSAQLQTAMGVLKDRDLTGCLAVSQGQIVRIRCR